MSIIALPLPFQIANGQTEDATPVMANFNYIANQVNASLVNVPTDPSNSNTSFGFAALSGQFAPGFGNTAFGYNALLSLVQGASAARNTAVGLNALTSLQSTADNVAVGYLAMNSANSTSKSVAIGSGALSTLTASSAYVAIGYNALNLMKGGTIADMVAVGYLAGANLGNFGGGGIGHTIVGSQALENATSAIQCTVIGAGAMQLANANHIIAIGAGAASGATMGDDNVILGNQAMSSTTNVSATRNTAIGHNTILALTTGSQNVALGHGAGNAGTALTTGSNNTLIGYQSQVNSAAASNRTALGAGAIGTVDNTLQFGNSAVTNATFGAAGACALGSAALPLKQFYADYTNTATIGNVIINKMAGRCILASGQATVTVTNSLVTAASHVFCQSSQGNITIVTVAPTAGSFTITVAAAPIADRSIDFLVINAD